MKNKSIYLYQYIAVLLLLSGLISCHRKLAGTNSAAKRTASLWLTNPDQSALFQKQSGPFIFSTASNNYPVIDVDESRKFQGIDGFGYCLTGGSAMLIHHMQPAARTALLKELFDTSGTNIGVSYLRISIGASDLDDRVFSYDDLPAGATDPQLAHFSLAPDRRHLIPVLKEILAINPHIKLLGSPWSAPAWMKTNNDTRGGSLKREYYDAYAQYFVKYIQGMKAEGITIDAITVQNEPLHPGNNPSMFMPAEEQALFIKSSLGPAFAAAGINTKIIVYDHNADRPDYPITIYKDPEASKYVDGAAFHLYAGKIETLSEVHNAFPDKNLYFTEQWIGGPGNFPADVAWHIRTLIIGATRNWCRTVLEWNLAADPNYNPHTDRGGCTRCLGAVTIDGNKFTRNQGYYIIAHASKFARPGSVRIASNIVGTLNNVAFLTPNGSKVLIVQNDGTSAQTFNIGYKGQMLTTTLQAGAVGTYVW